MEHYIIPIFVTIVISAIGLLVYNILWLNAVHFDFLHLGFLVKRSLFKDIGYMYKERIPKYKTDHIYLYKFITDYELNQDKGSITIHNDIDLKEFNAFKSSLDNDYDILNFAPLEVRLDKQEKPRLSIEIFNRSGVGKAIIAYNTIRTDAGKIIPLLRIFLYSIRDFESLKFSDSKASLFNTSYVGSYSISESKILTLSDCKPVSVWSEENE